MSRYVDDPEALGGSRPSIKALVNRKARGVDDARAELYLVLRAMDRDDLVDSERGLLRRRRVVLKQRIEGRDARYKAVGARVGHISAQDQYWVGMYQGTQALRELA